MLSPSLRRLEGRRSPIASRASPDPPLGPLVAQYHDVVRLYATFFNRGECIFPLARTPARLRCAGASSPPETFITQPPGARLPRRMAMPPSFFSGRSSSLMHILALGFARSPDLLPQAASCHGLLLRMKQTGFKEPLAHDRHSSSYIHLRCRISPPWPLIPQVPACDETSGQNRRWKAGWRNH